MEATIVYQGYIGITEKHKLLFRLGFRVADKELEL